LNVFAIGFLSAFIITSIIAFFVIGRIKTNNKNKQLETENNNLNRNVSGLAKQAAKTQESNKKAEEIRNEIETADNETLNDIYNSTNTDYDRLRQHKKYR
jgi:cell shape-determining protein MreC